MKISRFFSVVLLASALGGALAIGAYKAFVEKPAYYDFSAQQKAVLSKYEPLKTDQNYVVSKGLNFVHAATRITPAVVHIKTFYDGRTQSNEATDIFRDFFGDSPYHQQRSSSGSGVIITPEGYIATNNHVVDNASKLEVILEDKRRYDAEVIGTDPTTDLALIKINEKDLPFAVYGNSDNIKIGEWVLAVGNPFDLTSTVTAGIVSAKARNINIIGQKSGRYAIEAFIQTDAVVNPGNSGGALVDLNGQLIGINTAIATNTGSYSGYSFAVPVTLVKKVMDDLANYGEVQRALMGVTIQSVNAELAEREGLNKIKGVYIQQVMEGSAADDAGVETGDIILSVDDVEVNSASELQEQIALHHPGDKVQVVCQRGNKEETLTLILKSKNNTTDTAQASARTTLRIPELGAKLGPASEQDLDKLGLPYGVKVIELYPGRLQTAQIKEGFIITHIDKESVKSPEEISEMLDNKRGGVLLEGVYPDGTKEYIGLGF